MAGTAVGKTRRTSLATRGATARAGGAGSTAATSADCSRLVISICLGAALVLLAVLLPKCFFMSPCKQEAAGSERKGGPTLESVFGAADTGYKYHLQQREYSFTRDKVRPEESAKWGEAKMREIFLVPTYSCPFELRVGEWGEGGKWICNIFPFRREMRRAKRSLSDSADAPRTYQQGLYDTHPVVVYSVGSRDETSFEEAIYRLLNVEPYTMDPSLSLAKQDHMKSLPYVHFRNIGLTGRTKKRTPKTWGPLLRFTEVLRLLNHTYVDVLKIDCEGCEVDVMEDLLDEFSALPPVGQVLMEIHHVSIPKVQLRLLQVMEKLGFRLFHSENNERYLKAHETAFIHESLVDPSQWPLWES